MPAAGEVPVNGEDNGYTNGRANGSSGDVDGVLHAHDAHSLLPLLQRYQPKSLGILGAIVVNDERVQVGFPADLPRPPPLKTVYASFPPSALDSIIDSATARPDETDFVLATALPAPSVQIRVFHALETVPSPSTERLARAQALVEAAIMEMAVRVPGQRSVGSINTMWAEGVRRLVGGPDRGITYLWLAPLDATEDTEVQADLSGLEWDYGRPGDEVLMRDVNPYRSREYYAARAGYVTALRPPSTASDPRPLPVCWIMTHGDGALGALYTMPSHRRRGLARAVVVEHLKRYKALVGDGVARAFAHVEEGNDASEALWRSFGWKRDWTATWVYP